MTPTSQPKQPHNGLSLLRYVPNLVQAKHIVLFPVGELVVEQLLVHYGPRRSKWPKKLLKTLEKRNAALVAAISERLCYVPKEHFWPLGTAAKELITGKEGESLVQFVLG